MPQSMRPGQSTQPPSMMPPGRGGQIMAGPPQGNFDLLSETRFISALFISVNF